MTPDPRRMAQTANDIHGRLRGMLEQAEAKAQRYEDALEEIAERQMKDEHGFDMVPNMASAQAVAKRALGYPPEDAA